MNGSTFSYAYWPTPGGSTLLQTYTTGYNYYFQHKDWLGSSRVSSNLGTTIIDDRAFAPYGEMYQNFGSTAANELIFTGDTQDITPGLYDTLNRELNPSQGRWLSPDPVGSGWNLYGYATNPNSAIDPTGLAVESSGNLGNRCGAMFNPCIDPTLGLIGSQDLSDLDGLNAKLTAYNDSLVSQGSDPSSPTQQQNSNSTPGPQKVGGDPTGPGELQPTFPQQDGGCEAAGLPPC